MRKMGRADDLNNAKELLMADKIAKIRQDGEILEGLFIVSGNNDDYLVILPRYCTCRHFHLVCVREADRVCKHILATRMAGEKIRVFDVANWQDLLFREQ